MHFHLLVNGSCGDSLRALAIAIGFLSALLNMLVLTLTLGTGTSNAFLSILVYRPWFLLAGILAFRFACFRIGSDPAAFLPFAVRDVRMNFPFS
jgi:hypothetical protein